MRTQNKIRLKKNEFKTGITAVVQIRIILYYHNDHLGSTSVVTNSSGDLVEETFYAPYGEILEGGQVGRFTYEGREFSELAGDYDFRFRKYNPDLGMFTQPDALIPNVYDPQSLNRYRFERNNPYKYVDEDGKDAVRFYAGAGIGPTLLMQPLGGQFNIGTAFSYSKEYGFQMAPAFSFGGGMDIGVFLGKGTIGGEYSKEAKSVWDLAGESLTEGLNFAEGHGMGFGRSKNNEVIKTNFIEYSPGLGGHYYEYGTTTVVAPIAFSIKPKKPESYLDLHPLKMLIDMIKIDVRERTSSIGGGSWSSRSTTNSKSVSGIYTRMLGGNLCTGICVKS